jgi:hypothetical protein
MKTKFKGTISRMLFGCLLGILFVLWLGSVVGLNWDIGNVPNRLGIGTEKALAGIYDTEKAYEESLLADSLIVVDTSAAPGEAFWLTIKMVNTRPLLGWQMKLVYNASILYPDTFLVIDNSGEYPDTSWQFETRFAGRAAGYTEDDWYMVSPLIRYGHLDTLRFSTMLDLFAQPPPPLITVGSGPIIQFKFLVRPDAPVGAVTYIKFDPYWSYEQGEVYPANNFSDTSTVLLIPMTRDGVFTVKSSEEPDNNCPVFAFPTQSSFDVNEGTTLEFEVGATDVDADAITLSMDPLTPSDLDYSFNTQVGQGSVSSTFKYTPGFDEGPITRYLTFRVQDEHGCQVTKMVSINVIESLQNQLLASDEQGGLPGTKDNMTPFTLTHSVPIYGFQFTFRWDPTKLEVDSLSPTGVIEEFSMYTNLGDSAGKATILVFGVSGETIPPGVDTVVYAAFRVLPDAPPGGVEIKLESAREAINPGYPSHPLGMINGTFWVSAYGDANLDHIVDIGDLIALIHYILGGVIFDPEQLELGDVNQDDVIDVADLVAVIDLILGRWVAPTAPMYPGPMASIELDYQELLAGTSDEVKVMADLEVPVAGAQLEIEYDPDQVSFQVPRLSQRSEHFLVEYRDDEQGKLILIMYNMSNQPIPVGEGSIVSLPAVLNTYAQDNLEIQLKRVVLADENAALIPVGSGSPFIPVAFELDQNYPNPFNPSTTIRFSLPSHSTTGGLPTSLRIYNVMGQLVRTLVDEPLAEGSHQVIWDGKDDYGDQVASGVYFYKLRSGEYQETKKMVMMK